MGLNAGDSWTRKMVEMVLKSRKWPIRAGIRNKGTGSLQQGTWVVAQGKMTEEVGTGDQETEVCF